MYDPSLWLNEVELTLLFSRPGFSRRISLEAWATEKFRHSEYFFSDSYPDDRVYR
jgi:hypothetical protein